MKIYDLVMINARPEDIWLFVADPEMMMAWNPKVVNVVKLNSGEVQDGDTYKITYRMSSKNTTMQATVLEADRPHRLHIRMVDHMPGDTINTVDEYYDLTPKGKQTLLEQSINADLKINYFLRLLINLIMKFGKPTGERYLHKLKRLVEDSVHE